MNFFKKICELIINLAIDLLLLYAILLFILPKQRISTTNTVKNNLPTDEVIIVTSPPIDYYEKHHDANKPTAKLIKQKKVKIHTKSKKDKIQNTKPPKATAFEKSELTIAQRFWVKELGFDPFWNIPIYWQTDLPVHNGKLQPLGITKTLVGDFPLVENQKVAYMQIDDQAAKEQHIQLAQVLAHEWGHALGLKHGYGIMEPIASKMSWRTNKAQRAQIRRNYQAGH